MYKVSYCLFGLLALVIIVTFGLIAKAANGMVNGTLKTLTWLGT